MRDADDLPLAGESVGATTFPVTAGECADAVALTPHTARAASTETRNRRPTCCAFHMPSSPSETVSVISVNHGDIGQRNQGNWMQYAHHGATDDAPAVTSAAFRRSHS